MARLSSTSSAGIASGRQAQQAIRDLSGGKSRDNPSATAEGQDHRWRCLPMDWDACPIRQQHENTKHDRHWGSVMPDGIIWWLGIKKAKLIRLWCKMVAANSKEIKLIGTIFLKLVSQDENGALHEKSVMAYVLPSTDKFNRNKAVIGQLQVIPYTFPQVRAAAAIETNGPNNPMAYCGCPVRNTSPGPHAHLPFHATAENIGGDDGGLEFVADNTQSFLNRWGLQHHLTAIYHLQRNGRAKVRAKSMIWLLQCNTNADVPWMKTVLWQVCCKTQILQNPQQACLLQWSCLATP